MLSVPGSSSISQKTSYSDLWWAKMTPWLSARAGRFRNSPREPDAVTGWACPLSAATVTTTQGRLVFAVVFSKPPSSYLLTLARR